MKKLMKMCMSMFMAVIMLLTNFSFAAPVSNTARNTYLQLEKKNISSINKWISKNNMIFDTNFNTAREEMEIYGENLPSDFNNLKLKLVEEADIKNKYQYAEMVLGTKETDKISLEMIFKDNILMMQVPELYEKFVSVDFSKAKELCEKFEIEVAEEDVKEFTKLLSNAQNGSILSKADESYLKKTLPKYTKKLNALINPKYFSMSKKATVDYNATSISCQSVSFEITIDEAVKIINVLLSDFKNDEKLLDIFVYAVNSSSEVKINKDEIKVSLDEFTDMVKMYEEELKGMKFVSTLYYNNKKETLKREIKVVNTTLEEEIGFSFITINGSKGAYYELDLGDVKVIDRVTKSNKVQTHLIEMRSEGINYDFDYETYEIKEIPYTETESFKIMIETPDKKNSIVTFSKDGMDEKIIMKMKANVATSKKLDYNFEFVYDTADTDYKVFVNYLLEKNGKITKKTFKNPEVNVYKMSVDELRKEVENNKEVVPKKAESIFRELFPEMIKEAEETQKRMQARADKITGSMIGKALRVWETDVSTDPALGINDRISSTWREYTSFEEIEDYIMPDYIPQLDNGKFYVAKTGYGADARIVVAISNNGGFDLPSPDMVFETDYDGSKSGIVYIEP